MKLPKARNTDIIEQNLGNELLIYDLQINRAYTLNETSMKVYRACNGKQTFEDIRNSYQFNDELIHLALSGLQEINLITDYKSSDYFAGLSRREIIKKVGLATMIALPMIVSLTAPKSSQAASNSCGQSCGSPATCSVSCPTCIGNGVCSAGGATICSNIGTSCTGTGTCFGAFPGPYTCSIPGGFCAGPGSCSAPGICNGTGVCQ